MPERSAIFQMSIGLLCEERNTTRFRLKPPADIARPPSVELNKRASWGRIMAGRPKFPMFTCPNCKALYQVVKVEAGLETEDREITCRVCGGPFLGREGKFVLKVFPLEKSSQNTSAGIKLDFLDIARLRSRDGSSGGQSEELVVIKIAQPISTFGGNLDPIARSGC
jgi:hypothetical protein